MRHLLTILFLTFCFLGYSQVDTGYYYVYNTPSIIFTWCYQKTTHLSITTPEEAVAISGA